MQFLNQSKVKRRSFKVLTWINCLKLSEEEDIKSAYKSMIRWTFCAWEDKEEKLTSWCHYEFQSDKSTFARFENQETWRNQSIMKEWEILLFSFHSWRATWRNEGWNEPEI